LLFIALRPVQVAGVVAPGRGRPIDPFDVGDFDLALQPGEFGSEQFFVEDTCGEGEGMFR